MSPRTSYDPERDIDKSHVDNVEIVPNAVANADKPNPRKEAPAYVASLSPEERQKAERALVRKIDLRLLPMLIIMYILNYLDRNNIVRDPWPLLSILVADHLLGGCQIGRSRGRFGPGGSAISDLRQYSVCGLFVDAE